AHIIKNMLVWAELMSHPDGEVSFFNDSAKCIAPIYVDLHNYATSLGIIHNPKEIEPDKIQVNHLLESGFFSVSSLDYKCILDVGDIGPSYIPGHGHADVFSFELSLHGKRLFVNRGTSEYG
ncbi:heparinase II/III family protein, partial [Vibrio sp. F13]|uniref:heparinase II/III domain-containing protein n=1 Tax=Vibrio sp. F13 TaxID=2070777 RepID=UPI00113D9E1F